MCWLVGHRWDYALRTFGHLLERCGRCGATRYH
jgi:hypothetical protein